MATTKSGNSEDLRQNVTTYVEGGTITDRPLENGPFDEFYVSPEERKEFGVEDNEVLHWARDPERWMKLGEPINRVRQLERPVNRGGMSARMLFDKQGDPIYPGGLPGPDLVLMALPREVADQQQAEIDAGSEDYQAELEQTEEGWVGNYSNLDSGAERNARMRAEARKNRELGLIGGNSPTSGVPYPQAIRQMANRADEVENKQRMLREGGSHTQPTLDDFRKLMSGNDRKIHGMGNSGFPRNANSAVAQAARKGK